MSEQVREARLRAAGVLGVDSLTSFGDVRAVFCHDRIYTTVHEKVTWKRLKDVSKMEL